MKKRIIFLVASYLWVASCCGQINIEGRILDSLTHEPIPYCVVGFVDGDKTALSDKKGDFSVQNSTIGTLVISNVAYEEKRYTISQSKDLKTVYLQKKIITLKPVTINLHEKVLIAGEYDKRAKIVNKSNHFRWFGGRYAGTRVALFIPNPCTAPQIARIKTLHYYLIDPTDTGYLFRVQVYEAIPNRDSSISHGTPLISENIILRKPNHDGWVDIDVNKYGVRIPQNGMFVSVEFLQQMPVKYANIIAHTVKDEKTGITTYTTIDRFAETRSGAFITPMDRDYRKLVKKSENVMQILFNSPSKSFPENRWTYYSTCTTFFFDNAKNFGDKFAYDPFFPAFVGNPYIYVSYVIDE